MSHRYTRTDALGTRIADLIEAPGAPGIIDVTTELATQMWADAGRTDPLPDEWEPGVIPFTVAEMHTLLTSLGWTREDSP